MAINSYRWLPPSLAAWIQEKWKVEDERDSVPFAPLKKPVSRMRFALVTTGGLYLKGVQQPFDLAREEQDPDWGDPTYRVIPAGTQLGDVAVSHKHYNPADIEQDFNILLPIQRFQELAAAGEVGPVAPSHYSVMGYQGHPSSDCGAWKFLYGPEIVERMLAEEVDGVLLTPA